MSLLGIRGSKEWREDALIAPALLCFPESVESWMADQNGGIISMMFEYRLFNTLHWKSKWEYFWTRASNFRSRVFF